MLPSGYVTRKRWKRIKEEEEKEEGRRMGKWKDLASRIIPITGIFRSQVLQKTLAAFPRSLSPAHYVLCASTSPCVFFPHFILWSHWVTHGEVLPAVCFPSVTECSHLQHLGSFFSGAFNDSLQTSWRTKSMFSQPNQQLRKSSKSTFPCNYVLVWHICNLLQINLSVTIYSFVILDYFYF